jgi:hypothetical protein
MVMSSGASVPWLRSCLAVCHNRRIRQHRVFRGLAERGKTSVDWFFGFKLHLVFNDQGELLTLLLTPGNVDDCMRHIQNAWEQINCCKLMEDPTGTFSPQEQLLLLRLLDSQCWQIIYWCGYKTIPARLNEWIDGSNPGYAIPFHAVFENEVSDAEDRHKLLNYFALSPKEFQGGIIDPNSGAACLADHPIRSFC